MHARVCEGECAAAAATSCICMCVHHLSAWRPDHQHTIACPSCLTWCRWGHGAFVFEQQLWVYGGSDGEQTFTDMWTLDLASLSWSKRQQRGVLPNRQLGKYKSFLATTVLAAGHSMLAFGMQQQVRNQWHQSAHQGTCWSLSISQLNMQHGTWESSTTASSAAQHSTACDGAGQRCHVPHAVCKALWTSTLTVSSFTAQDENADPVSKSGLRLYAFDLGQHKWSAVHTAGTPNFSKLEALQCHGNTLIALGWSGGKSESDMQVSTATVRLVQEQCSTHLCRLCMLTSSRLCTHGGCQGPQHLHPTPGPIMCAAGLLPGPQQHQLLPHTLLHSWLHQPQQPHAQLAGGAGAGHAALCTHCCCHCRAGQPSDAAWGRAVQQERVRQAGCRHLPAGPEQMVLDAHVSSTGEGSGQQHHQPAKGKPHGCARAQCSCSHADR